MSRASVISPYQKFYGLDGLTSLSLGTITFYFNETTDLATIYEDSDLTVVQDNPYTLDAGGMIQGDVHFEGSLSLLVKDSTGAEIRTIDNVTCFDPVAAFSAWNEFAIYGEGGPNIVTASDGNYYVSLVPDNEGNDPISSPSEWELISFFPGTSAQAARVAEIGAISPANQALIIGTATGWEGTTLAAITPNYLGGLQTSVNVTDPDHDIDVTAGRANNSANTLTIALTAAMTKQIDATWAAGTNQGGLASGASLANNTTYHVFVVLVGGVGDVMFDTSVTCANGVANNAVTSFRRIASIYTDGSANIVKYFQSGDEFTLDVMVQDVNTNDPGETAVTAALSVPSGIAVLSKVTAALQSASSTKSGSLLLTALKQTDTAPSGVIYNIFVLSQSVDDNVFGTLAFVETNTSAQIRYRLEVDATGTTDFTVMINTIGWIDKRGR